MREGRIVIFVFYGKAITLVVTLTLTYFTLGWLSETNGT
jgi:hypothetical protein